MRKSLVRWTLRILLLAGICAAAFTAEVRTAPVAKAATCDIAAWYKVAGPADGPTINGVKVRAWLYAYKDLNNGQFCGLLHSSVDWTQNSGTCSYFIAAVMNYATLPPYIASSKQVHSCSTSGSLQSPFYRPSTHGCYRGAGQPYEKGQALTGCYYT